MQVQVHTSSLQVFPVRLLVIASEELSFVCLSYHASAFQCLVTLVCYYAQWCWDGYSAQMYSL